MSNGNVDHMEGIEGVDKQAIGAVMNEDEKRVLAVYDRLEQLQFEIELLKSRGILSQGPSAKEVSQKDTETAQQELLEAKATYQVRSNVVESVLVSHPILNAVHAGVNGLQVEQDLLPLLQRRDKLSISLNRICKEVLDTRNQWKEIASQNLILGRENASLAKTMLILAEEAHAQRKEDITDLETRGQLDVMEAEMESSHRKWRIIKGTASAMIAGSGIDWARDPELVDIVLDSEN